MLQLLSSFLKLIFLFALLLLIHSTKAQIPLTNVPQAFDAIAAKPIVIYLKNKEVNIPLGGHLQGIQKLNDSVVIITASSASFSYYLIAQFIHQKPGGQITSIQKIADSPFRHAGGCQTYNHQLLVGVEDNWARDKSDIMLISFNDSLRQTAQGMIAHRTGPVKRVTAGAAGFTQLPTGEYLAAVGDWDSRNIDFYLSKPGNDSSFVPFTGFQAEDNKKWPSYQSINLITDTTGTAYLIGFALNGIHNRADLFEVEFDKMHASLKLISTRNFNCKRGAGFRYGSGIAICHNHLTIYSCGRNVSAHTPVNIFR